MIGIRKINNDIFLQVMRNIFNIFWKWYAVIHGTHLTRKKHDNRLVWNRNGKIFKVENMEVCQMIWQNALYLKVSKNKVITVKPLNSGLLRVLKTLSFIKRCPLLGSSLTKIVTFGTKHFARYLRHVRYLGCPVLGGFTVYRNR